MIRSSVDAGGFAIGPGDEEAIDALNASNLAPFMTWESPGNWRWGALYDLYPELQLAVHRDGELVGAANIVPAKRGAGVTPGLGGYDDIVVNAVETPGQAADCLSLLSISLVPAARRTGLAELLVQHAKRLAGERGFESVIAPLRPTRKHRYPLIDIERYTGWKLSDGSAFDPWLRLHQTLGGTAAGTAPNSLVIDQPVERWERALDLTLPADGEYVVDGALSPLAVRAGRGIYVEPNIWISHPVAAASARSHRRDPAETSRTKEHSDR